MTPGSADKPGPPQREPASSPGRPETAAMRSRGTRRAVAVIAALVLAADQASKSLVVSADPGSGGSGLVSVRLVRNTGASFGIGARHPLLITLTAAAVLAIAMLLLARTRSRATALSLGAVAGGAAGNLADRLLRGPGPGRGAVVDWIHLAGYPATFNIADIAIRLGALCAVIAAISSGPARLGRPRAARWRHAATGLFPRSRPCSR
jgi:signal peptidase II